MPNNNCSINILYVHQNVFSQLQNARRSFKNGQLLVLENALVEQLRRDGCYDLESTVVTYY